MGVVKLSSATNTFFLHTSSSLSLALSLSPPFHRRTWLCVCAFLFLFSFLSFFCKRCEVKFVFAAAAQFDAVKRGREAAFVLRLLA